jgi:hypothetical protein
MNGLEFARKYGIIATVKFVDDVSAASDPDGWPHTAYAVTLKHKRQKLTVPFKMGLAHTSEPELADVLLAISSDARSGEHTHSEFCGEFGLDEDSIRDFKTWEACREMKHKAYGWCSSEQMWDDFKEISE